MACVPGVPRWVYAGGMKARTKREARIGIKAFDSEEEGWRAAAAAEGMNLSAWVRRACDRAKVAEELARRRAERWPG